MKKNILIAILLMVSAISWGQQIDDIQDKKNNSNLRKELNKKAKIPTLLNETEKVQYKSALDILTKTEATPLFASKIDTGSIVNATWYSDAEVNALLDSVKATTVTYTIPTNTQMNTPVDGTTYYFGFPDVDVNWDGNAGYHSIEIPVASKLIGFTSSIRSTAGSSETFSIWVTKNNANPYLLSDQFLTSASAGAVKHKSSYALNFTFAAGDKLEFKVTAPTWATNPTSVYGKFILIFKVL